MSLKGRGQGVDLGTSILSFILSIFFSFFGLQFPYEPLNLFPFLVFLSPRPHSIASPGDDAAMDDAREENTIRCSTADATLRAAALHHWIIAISAADWSIWFLFWYSEVLNPRNCGAPGGMCLLDWSIFHAKGLYFGFIT